MAMKEKDSTEQNNVPPMGSITRRLNTAVSDFQNSFEIFCDNVDFERALAQIKRSKNKSNYLSSLSSIYRLFDSCNIQYKKGEDYPYYRGLVDESIKNGKICTIFNIENKFIDSVFMLYKEYPSPQDYIKRIVDRLCNKDDKWENDTLRVRILKQFVKYGDCLQNSGYKSGKRCILNYVITKTGNKKLSFEHPEDIELIIENIDDGIFAEFDKRTTTKDQKEYYGKFGILKPADDIANGKFRTNNGTKKHLYLFACVYGMTYGEGDPKTDIEKNLFFDYYTNNLIRYLQDEYINDLNSYERDPSGVGINYKNFAEVIYLYYLTKNELSASEKLKLSYEMIMRVKASSNEYHELNGEETKSIKYRNLVKKDMNVISSENILKYDTNTFEKMISEIYFHNTAVTKNHFIGPMELDIEQNTALKSYQSIVKEIKNTINEINKNNNIDKNQIKNINMPNYGLWFADHRKFIDESSSQSLSTHTKTEKFKSSLSDFQKRHNVTEDEYRKFVSLLFNISKFLTDENLAEKNAKKMSRSRLISAYYYLYNERKQLQLQCNNNRAIRVASFKDVYLEFCNGVNNINGIDEILEKIGYQKINSKNLFDVLVIFSAYSRLKI